MVFTEFKFSLFSDIDETIPSHTDKKLEPEDLSTFEPNGEEKDEELKNEQKSQHNNDITLLVKLFPKVEKSILIETLFNCKGNTVEAIQKLLNNANDNKNKEDQIEDQEPEEKKMKLNHQTSPPSPIPCIQNQQNEFPRMEPDLKALNMTSPFRYNHQR